VIVCETSGTDPRRSAIPTAAVKLGAMISIAFAPVRGSFLSSRNVATDSTFGLRRCSGLKSNGRKATGGEASTTTRIMITITGRRCRSINRSTGASAAMPIGRASAGGFKTENSAGRSVILVRKAIIIPEPAICPSSARPRYAVGTNDENLAAITAAASARGAPAFLAALIRASRRSRNS
jgi:hypothetical protein